MITITKGTASPSPVRAHSGHHVWSASQAITDWNAPSTSPATQAVGNDVRRPTRATANAGIT